MTLQVQILIPAGQSFAAKIVAVNRYNGETRETDLVNPATPGVIHSVHATNTRSIEVRELLPEPAQATEG